MSDRQVARVRLASYTENQAAQPFADVALDLSTNFHVDATWLDVPVATPPVRG